MPDAAIRLRYMLDASTPSCHEFSRMHVTAALQSMQRENDGLRYRSPAINTANDRCSHRGIGALEIYTRRRLEILLAISLIEKEYFVERMRQNVPAIIVLEIREK